MTLATAFGLTACAVGPDYVRPETATNPAWTSPLDGGVAALPPDQAALAKFWTALEDPLLNELVERALTGNPDLRHAAARLEQARDLRKVAIGAFFPTITASSEAERVYNAGQAVTVNGARAVSGHVDRYSANLDASWEIDLFGRLRRGLEAANADRDAAIEDLRDVQVSLVAELVLDYVDARAVQERVQIAQATLDSQLETYNITDWRAQAGLTTDLDVERARSSLETTRSTIPNLHTALAADLNAISILLGEQPGAVNEQMAEPQKIPVTPAEVAVGVPADTIAQRPDVRRAERQLAAETARIGVATANAYPTLNALGSIGLEALSPGGLFRAGATTGLLAGTATETLFSGGQVIARIQEQYAVRDQTLAAYQSSVLTALSDVENALVAYAQEQDRRKALSDGADAAAQALVLAQDQYGSGLIDFQVVLDAQRSLYVLQDQLAESEGLVTTNLVRLYKALGGGWSPEVTS
ncbi:MAG TPA: efflux transporter outer membrane subunit [Myxococcota bacterium]|nr:efflux transporter outer membrane subunit [Myxococcota bacterium]